MNNHEASSSNPLKIDDDSDDLGEEAAQHTQPNDITVKDTDGVIGIHRPQRLEDIVGEDKLRYDKDIKAVNILLLGLPVDIYTLINHYQSAKEIWDRVKELMEGTKMTKQECESMLYDEFDKLTSEPEESIHSYYLRYAKLINDMNMISMSMTPMQINTKFYEKDAKEFREMRQRFPKPLALLAKTYNPPLSYNNHQTQYRTQPTEVYPPYQHYQSNTSITQQLIQSNPLQSYAPTIVQQPQTIQPDTRFVAPTFLSTNDPIESLNKAMIFLSSIQSQGYARNARNNQASRAQCTTRKRVKDSESFKDKMLLAQAQEAGVVLNEEQQDFLANSLEETDDFKPRYDSDMLYEVPHHNTYHDYDMLNYNIQELGYIENIVSNNQSYDELTGNSNDISYTNYMLTIGNGEDKAAFWYGEPLSRSAVLETINEENKHKSQANDSVCLPPQIGWLSYACHVNFHTMAGITCFETCTMCGCYTTYQLKSKKVLEVLNGSREALITEHGFWCSGIHDVPIKDALYPIVGYYRL
nr:hypothetical protein [Tanacetum cinerariifolium]